MCRAMIKTLQRCLSTQGNTSLRFLQHADEAACQQPNQLKLDESSICGPAAPKEDDGVCGGLFHLSRAGLCIPTYLIFQSMRIIARKL